MQTFDLSYTHQTNQCFFKQKMYVHACHGMQTVFHPCTYLPETLLPNHSSPCRALSSSLCCMDVQHINGRTVGHVRQHSHPVCGICIKPNSDTSLSGMTTCCACARKHAKSISGLLKWSVRGLSHVKRQGDNSIFNPIPCFVTCSEPSLPGSLPWDLKA